MTDLVYIMGHGYSGSTLLTFLLGSASADRHHRRARDRPAGQGVDARRSTSAPATPRSATATSGSASAKEMAERGHPFDIWDADLDFRARDGGLADVVLRAVQRGPVLETARSAGAARRPRRPPRAGPHPLPHRGAGRDRRRQIKGSGVFLDSSKRPERATLHAPRAAASTCG